MVIYIFLFLFLALASYLDLVNRKKGFNKDILLLFMIIFIFLAGARWKTGTDWWPYFNYFEQNNSLEDFLNGEFEFGFSGLNFIVKSVSDSYTLFLFVQAFLILMLKTWSIYTFSNFPLLSYFFNLSNFLGDIFFVRQNIAIAITLLSTFFIIQKRFFIFSGLIILASFFHISALGFFPAYFIYKAKINRLWLISFVLISLLISQSGILLNLLETLANILYGDEGFIAYKFMIYAQNAQNNPVTEDLLFLSFIRRIFLLPILIWAKPYIERKYLYYSGFLNLSIVGYSLFFLLADFSQAVAGRFSVYYFIYDLFIIPALIYLTSNVVLQRLLWIGFILYGGVKFIYALYGYYDLYVPYIFFFENIDRGIY